MKTPITLDIGDTPIDAPILIPMEPPQHDSVDLTASIRDLMESARPFTEEMATELLFLCKTTPTVCSALAYAMILTKNAEVALRTTQTWDETCRKQGEIAGLSTYFSGLMSMLEAIESAQGESNVSQN